MRDHTGQRNSRFYGSHFRAHDSGTERKAMPKTEAKETTKSTFWTTWQTVVGVPGALLIGWMFFAPVDLRLHNYQILVAWLAIFAVATVAALIRSKSQPLR